MSPFVLMYHSITAGEPADPYGVSKKNFYDQITWLLDQDYHILPLETIAQYGRYNIFRGRKKQVILTFDDGYRDFMSNALTILSDYKLPATVFLVIDMFGRTASWSRYSKKVPLMSETDLRIIKEQGINLGSHTLTHADLPALGNKDLRRQLVFSRQFGETFFSFSYPWGRYTNREVAAVEAAGYDCAVAVHRQTPWFILDKYRLGRVPMHRDLNLNDFRDLISNPMRPFYLDSMSRKFMRRVRERFF